MPVVGPALRRVAHEIPLTVPPASPGITRIAGGAVASDGSLRVVLRGTLFAIDPATRLVQWARLSLGGSPMPLFPVRAGLMATIVGDTLLLIE